MPRPRKAKLHRDGYQPGHHASPGEGSIVPVKGGTRWRGAYRWTDPDTGERKRIWITGRDEADVKALWALRLAQLERRPEALPPEATTLDRYLAQWLTDVVRVGNRITTYEKYLHICKRVPQWLGVVPLVKLQPSHLDRWYGELSAEGLAPSSVRGAHRTIHSALNHAVHLGLVDRNPADRATAPRVRRPDVKSLAPDEARAALAAVLASTHPLRAVWLVIATTGLRRGEALGLRWRDLDLDTGALTVRQQLVPTSTQGLVVEDPKTGRSQRPLRLTLPVIQALRDHRAQVPGEPANNDLVFIGRHGGGIPGTTVDTAWRRFLIASGLPHIHLHGLRHTVASLLIAQGMDPRTVGDQLGHANPTQTLNTYSHAIPGAAQRVADTLAAILMPVSGDEVAREVANPVSLVKFTRKTG